MAIIKKYSPFQNLSNFQTFLVDENPNSDYFRITEFKDTFTGGKNGFLIEGSEFLKETTEVKIEVLDVEGNPVYFEPGDGNPEYYEGLSKLVAVHVYDDTPIGIGKITILGELKNYVNDVGNVVPVPQEWKGVYNVKWEKTFKINKNLPNEDIVRFYKRPIIQIEELVKPIFTKTVQSATDTVEVSGIPQQPIGGTDLTSWRAGTLYKLVRATGSWDVDVDENEITVSIDGGTYTPTIIEVLNDKEVLVDVPYTDSNNIVSSFTSQSSTTTYQDFENETIGESALTGSFAKIDLFQLKTFVGDVARVKVFRKSRNAVGDFQFVQESRLESTELLRDVTTTSDTEISYGRFSEDNLSNYWTTSSNDHTTTVNSSILAQAVKVDYDNTAGGVQLLKTDESFTLSKDVEYELSFRTLLSGSTDSSKYLKAYFSGSYTNNLNNEASYSQSFMYISGSGIYTTRQNVSQNILAERDIDAKLVFEFKGDDWYVSNVSLRNAQETSFSPDEFTLIQDIPRKLPVETFDFRFEFYDINNNYIPVDVVASKEFTGGNDFGTTTKLLTFESDRNAFRFSTGSIGNPYNQTIQFKTTAQNLTGSILFESQAFDVDGNYLDPSDYSQYPGLLTNVTTAGALLTLNNFTGSYSGGGSRPYVGSIVYTASLESQQEFETVYRLEDGDNAPQLIVTSNANQFIYEPTELEPKPSGQSITIRAQRKNLASLTTPITVTSGSNLPELTQGLTENGITTYTISALQFSSSFADNDFDEVTYSFTGSDVFGNNQSDEITLSKVINFDGVSVVLSNESTAFNASSTGTVTSGEFDSGDGTVDVRVGSKTISHSEGLGTKNTFDIISVTPSSGLTANDETPTTNSYGISAMTVDAGSLDLLIRYKAGDNSTTVDFSKKVNYTKARKGTPNVEVAVRPAGQTIEANSLGSGSTSPQTLTVTALEGGTNRFTSIGTPTYSGGISGTVSSNTITFTDTASDMTSDTETVTIPINYTDSEGTSGQKTVVASISRVRKSAPVDVILANPQSQTIQSGSSGYDNAALQDITLTINEGGANYSYDDSSPYGNSTFRITDAGGGTNNNDGTVTPPNVTTDSGLSETITFAYKNSEGTEFTSKIIDYGVAVSKQGINGIDGDPGPSGSDGADGADGDDGATGPGVVFRGKWDSTVAYKFSTDVGDGLGRRDSVMYGSNDYIYGTLQNSTNQAPTGTTSDNAYWQFLGSEQMFVAAEIAIFKNSFVKETLNVGLNAEGDEANIAIVGGSSSPYISLGQSSQGFNNDGIFIGTDSSAQKLSLVGDNGSLSWDGSSLNISGSVTITGGSGISNLTDAGAFATLDEATLSLITDAGAMAGIDSITSGNASTYIGSGAITTGFIAANTIVAGNIAANTITTSELSTDAIKSTNYAYSSGNFSTAGSFFDLSDGSITSQNFAINSDGDAFYSGQVTAGTVVLGPEADGTNDGIYIDATNYWVDGGSIPFSVGSATGNLRFSTTQGLGLVTNAGADSAIISMFNGSNSGAYITPYGLGLYPEGVGQTITGKVYMGGSQMYGRVNGSNKDIVLEATSGGFIEIDPDLYVTGDIDADGNITAFASSDKKLKDNIIPISNALQKIIKIGGYEFDWNKNQKTYEGHDVGVIAQEIKEVLPEVVTEKKDGYLGVRYEKIVPLLIEGIKELTNKVESLEQEIFKLKEKK